MNKHLSENITLALKGAALEGLLEIPPHARALILFAHGSGSSRFSPRNQFVAKHLQEQGLATLLIDLLTAKEEERDERTRELRFSIDWLSDRLLQITDWLGKDVRTDKLQLGYFGASTGAAAALQAAARSKHPIFAVVSRGGRGDLAKAFLPKVKAPTLLIVGENDEQVIELNQEAFALLNCEKKFEIVPGATHLFEEPGCLEKVAKLSAAWFLQHQEKSQ